MAADEIPGLADPLVVRNRLYLRCSGGAHVVRPPAAPAVLAGTAALDLYRHLDGEPYGGGILTLALDLGAPSDDSDQADGALPSEIGDVLAPQHADGEVHLVLGGQRLAGGPLPAGARPVVPLAAGLDMTQATLLRSVLGPGRPAALGATATGTLVVSGGPVGRVEVDRDRARPELAGAARLTGGDVADALDRLLEQGVVRVTLEESFVPRPGWPPLAFAAAALFEPLVTGHAWSAVPGLRLPGYAPETLWQPGSGTGTVSLALDGTRVPWAAAAPLPLDRLAESQWDLPGSRVLAVLVRVSGGWPAEVTGPAIEVRIADGPVTTVPLSAEPRTVRVVPPEGAPRAYSWRVTARRRDHSVAGAWTTSEDLDLVVQAAEQLPEHDTTSERGAAI